MAEVETSASCPELVLFYSAYGGERTVHLDKGVLDRLDGGRGEVVRQLFRYIISVPGLGRQRFSAPPTDDLSAESAESLVDIAKGKPIFPLFCITPSEKEKGCLDVVRKALAFLRRHSSDVGSLAVALEPMARDLEVQIFGRTTGDMHVLDVADGLAALRREFRDIDFGRIAEVFSLCGNARAAILCSGLYHVYSSRAIPARTSGLDHALTAVARSVSDLLSSHLSYGSLLLNLLLCGHSYPRCSKFNDSYSILGGFKAVPTVERNALIHALGTTADETDLNTTGMPISVDCLGSATYPSHAAGKGFHERGLSDMTPLEDPQLLELLSEWPTHMGPCVQSMICATYRACRLIESGCILPFAHRAASVQVELPAAVGACNRCSTWHLEWMHKWIDALLALLPHLSVIGVDEFEQVTAATFRQILEDDVLKIGGETYVRGDQSAVAMELERLFDGGLREVFGADSWGPVPSVEP